MRIPDPINTDGISKENAPEGDASSSSDPSRVPLSNSSTATKHKTPDVDSMNNDSSGTRASSTTPEEKQQRFSNSWTRRPGRTTQRSNAGNDNNVRTDESTRNGNGGGGGEERQPPFRNAWTGFKGNAKRSSTGNNSKTGGSTPGGSSGAGAKAHRGGGDGNSRQRFGGGGDGSGRTSRSSSGKKPFFPPEITSHPAPSLKVEDRMTGLLVHKDQQSTVSASYVDGSFRLSKSVGETPRDGKGKQVGPTPKFITTLINSDTNKVMEVHRLRAEIAAAERGKGPGAKEDKKATGTGFLPFFNAGRKEQQRREHAKAHLGEVVTTISNRGVLVRTLALQRAGARYCQPCVHEGPSAHRNTSSLLCGGCIMLCPKTPFGSGE